MDDARERYFTSKKTLSEVQVVLINPSNSTEGECFPTMSYCAVSVEDHILINFGVVLEYRKADNQVDVTP